MSCFQPTVVSAGQLSRRAQLMLDLIIDIKNNKTSISGGAGAAASASASAPNVSLGGTATKQGKGAAAAGAGGGGRRGGSLAVLQPSVAKWLQQIGAEEVCLRGLTWTKLMAPNKKGELGCGKGCRSEARAPLCVYVCVLLHF